MSRSTEVERLRASAFLSLMVCTTSLASDSRKAASEAVIRRPAAGDMRISAATALIRDGLSGGKSPTLTVCVR